MIDSTMLETI